MSGYIIFGLIFLIKNSIGFFFGTSSCNCSPPPPPPICAPQACGPSRVQYQSQPFPPLPSIVYRPQLSQPTPQLNSYPNNVVPAPIFNFGSPPRNSYVEPPAESVEILASTPSATSHTISTPPTESFPGIGAEYGTGNAGYINKNVKNDEFAFEILPPPPPAVTREEEVPSKKKMKMFPDYEQQGDAVVPQITTPDADEKSENQIEVEPSQTKNEPRNAKHVEDNGDFQSKVIKKPSMHHKTSTPPPSMVMSMDLYDEHIPDIDTFFENTSNKTRNKFNKKMKHDILADDYSENSYRTKVFGVRNDERLENDYSGKREKNDGKCGNAILKRIMLENIVSSPTISKQLIFSAGKLQFRKQIDVVCSRNKFSYTVVSSKIFCEVTRPPVTCFAFFQP